MRHLCTQRLGLQDSAQFRGSNNCHQREVGSTQWAHFFLTTQKIFPGKKSYSERKFLAHFLASLCFFIWNTVRGNWPYPFTCFVSTYSWCLHLRIHFQHTFLVGSETSGLTWVGSTLRRYNTLVLFLPTSQVDVHK